ncbi:MAG: YidC/Oxa1 family membrane protein insertase, partial [Acidimicrobiales bacterium]|nr:YidC/Oxa1 family membrane protein insertase [Acidimicrobiales bacterium]
FYDLIPNYAVAITGLTLVVLGALTPITLKGTRSMLAMQKLQPEMKRIQEMHKGDRVAQNEAMMVFYKEHKINPLAGCLPMLAQIPVLLVMFRVLSKLVEKKETAQSAAECVGSMIKGKCTIGTPSYLNQDSDLYQALVKSGGRMVSFGVDFGLAPSKAGRGAVFLYLLIVLVVITSFIQVRQMTARSSSDIPPQMQMMNRVTPFFSGFVSLNLPGGVSLYFLVSNLFRITQQGLMYRFDPHLRSHMEEVKEVKSKAANLPPQPKKGLFASLKEQAEEREANRRPSGNGNGKVIDTRSNASSRPQSGRVTPPGQRNPQSRKRSKKRR